MKDQLTTVQRAAATLLLTLSAVQLSAQTHNRDVPLRNWQAPLYWQPSAAESEAIRTQANLRTPTPDAATPAGSLVFVAMPPCRVVDTRSSQNFPAAFGPPSLMPNMTRTFPIQSSGNCTIPSNAMAYSFNVTLVPTTLGTSVGYLTIWPTAASPNTPPNAVTVDDITGDIRNNAAIVPAGINNGSVSAITNGNTDLVIDINGYFAPSTGVTLMQGTASAPALSFSNDAGTGLFSSGMGKLDFTSGGTDVFDIASNGNLNITGNILQNGKPFLIDSGSQNLGVGLNALAADTSGQSNTAVGPNAMTSTTIGSNITAVGTNALKLNTTSGASVAVGTGALQNSNADANTAIGCNAMQYNTSGAGNTATGFQSLILNSTGANNVAYGLQSLNNNTSGSNNVAVGYQALFHNNGPSNTAIGNSALINSTSGGNNIALGTFAGQNIGSGSYNIDIGNNGSSGDGTSANSGVIRIGDPNNQTSFFAAGISGVNVTGAAVVVNSSGQLGVIASSRRFKEDIEDMDDASDGLLRLRPVKFRYRQPYADGSQPMDYGLIAEEVAEVYPDLVVKSADGQIQTVQYHKLTPMLLNELQKEHATNRSLQAQLAALEKTVESLMAGKAQQ